MEGHPAATGRAEVGRQSRKRRIGGFPMGRQAHWVRRVELVR